MKSVNQTVINNANTVFEKKDDKYFGYKSRFGDIVIGGAYSYRFVVHYAKTNQDVVIIPGDVNTVTTPVCTTLEERLWQPEKTAQARRDEIVEQAKADVDLCGKSGTPIPSDILKFWPKDNGKERYLPIHEVEYVVNHDKRTVVALIKRIGGEVVAKGISKAAPSDCFNVHIGKAIALRRALGLAVPDEYLNAPQPTEVRVGDVVESHVVKDTAIVISDGSWPPLSGAWIEQKYARKYGLKIIDDSREEVGE